MTRKRHVVEGAMAASPLRAASRSAARTKTTARGRLRLKQAFGRVIRRAGDRGMFARLDPMMPSRIEGAFPEGVALRRAGLAVAETKAFPTPA